MLRSANLWGWLSRHTLSFLCKAQLGGAEGFGHVRGCEVLCSSTDASSSSLLQEAVVLDCKDERGGDWISLVQHTRAMSDLPGLAGTQGNALTPGS